MYPAAFRYHRAKTLDEAAATLSNLGEDARPLAGGQSLIPLMKLRLAAPRHLVDLNFIPDLSYIRQDRDTIRIGPLTRHAELERSPLIRQIPILHDCAAGIADVQVRNRGTLAGSIAEADPSGDWAPVLMTLESEIACNGPDGRRTLALCDFITDAYTTALRHGELIEEVRVKVPPDGAAGAYIAYKRCAPVYATASAAVRIALEGGICRSAAIALGCVGLTTIRADAAARELTGQPITSKTMDAAAEAAGDTADPQPDLRGSVEYKKTLVRALVKRAIVTAVQRARGEQVKIGHEYA